METKTIQFTAGRGPAECTWVVAKVLRTFIKNSSNAGISYTILHQEKGVEN
jgi:peptide chain release factor